MNLVKYRDPESPDYIWFWINHSEEITSPVFTTEGDALEWLNEQIDPWDNWKPCKDIS